MAWACDSVMLKYNGFVATLISKNECEETFSCEKDFVAERRQMETSIDQGDKMSKGATGVKTLHNVR